MPCFVARLVAPLLALVAISLGAPTLAQDSIDPTRIRMVDRLKVSSLKTVALGTPFDVRVKFPKGGVLNVTMRQIDEHGHFDHMEDLPVVLDKNDQTVAKITPLAMGRVHFLINAAFSDSGLSIVEFTVQVGPPTRALQKIIGDLDFVNKGHTIRFIGLGNKDFKLDPVAFFESAPSHEVHVRGLATYRLLPSEGPPVVALTEDGTLSALQLGTAMAEVSLAGATSQFPINVFRE